MSKKEQNHLLNFQGQLLVAMPGMQDVRFKDALVLICGHDQNGAMGIIVNKVINDVSLKDIIDRMNLEDKQDIPDCVVHYGGPVEIGRGFVLHTTDCVHEASVTITNDLALTASTDIFEHVAQGRGPDHMLVALGYAGWSRKQLDEEIQKNFWLIMPADASLLFDKNPDNLWERTLKKFGIDPNYLSLHAGNA